MRSYLRDMRNEMGLSQGTVADKMGVAQNTYAMIELGERQVDMSLSVIKKLSNAFGVPIEFIIEQETALSEC